MAWIGFALALGALVVLLRPAPPTAAPPAARPPAPTPAATPEPTPPAENRADAPPDAPRSALDRQIEREQLDHERALFDQALLDAMSTFRPEPAVERKENLLPNTVSDCRLVNSQVVGSRPGSFDFSLKYECRFSEGARAYLRGFYLPGRAERSPDRWVITLP